MEYVQDPREEVMTLERVLLQTIKFDLQVDHPYSSILKYAKCLKGDKPKLHKMVQMSWTFVNDSLCTTLCLQWEPEVIAIALMYLASKLSKFEVRDWKNRTPEHKYWWDQYVRDLETDVLEDICHQVLDLYSQPTTETKLAPHSPPPATRGLKPRDPAAVAAAAAAPTPPATAAPAAPPPPQPASKPPLPPSKPAPPPSQPPGYPAAPVGAGYPAPGYLLPANGAPGYPGYPGQPPQTYAAVAATPPTFTPPTSQPPPPMSGHPPPRGHPPPPADYHHSRSHPPPRGHPADRNHPPPDNYRGPPHDGYRGRSGRGPPPRDGKTQ